MEGVGSRLGRASFRYGPSSTAAVFNGPVRKWKKKWVHASPSTTAGNHNSHSQSNGLSGNSNNNSRLLLCRWTPLPSTTSTATAVDTLSEEPPRRKFRYTPIVVLEEQKKAAKKVDHEATTFRSNREFSPLRASKNDELNLDATSKTETQDSNTSSLDLGLCLKGHHSNNDSIGQRNGDQAKKAASGGFWITG